MAWIEVTVGSTDWFSCVTLYNRCTAVGRHKYAVLADNGVKIYSIRDSNIVIFYPANPKNMIYIIKLSSEPTFING